MSYQLPPLLDDVDFERLVRDIARRVYDDPGIERYGRKGQAQSGIDGFSPADPTVTFQTKLKDTRHEPDHRIRDNLLKEMEEELEKTDLLPTTLTRFIFASTFKNDTELQNKATVLSSDTLKVEYWGWDTINERIWDFAEQLIPIYYPEIPIRLVHGFKQISPQLIEKARITDQGKLQRLALDYYRINDRSDVVFRIVCNLNLDLENLQARTELAKIYQRQGKLEEAEKRLLESLAIDEKQLHPRTELAKIYQRQGKLEEAEEVLMELLRLEPDDLQARTELAKIYQRQGKLEEAEEVLMELLNLDLENLQARTELAKIYQRQGKFDEAVTRAEEVLALEPLNDFAMSELLGTWERLGEKEKCKQRYFAFIDQPGYKFSRYSQAPVFRFFRCCRRFGMKQEAQTIYERFRSQLDDRNRDFYESTFIR